MLREEKGLPRANACSAIILAGLLLESAASLSLRLPLPELLLRVVACRSVVPPDSASGPVAVPGGLMKKIQTQPTDCPTPYYMYLPSGTL